MGQHRHCRGLQWESTGHEAQGKHESYPKHCKQPNKAGESQYDKRYHEMLCTPDGNKAVP